MGKSLRGAINAKCKDCIYDPRSGHGTWRQQVDGCTAESCPLWGVRPRSAGGPVDGPEKAPNESKEGV